MSAYDKPTPRVLHTSLLGRRVEVRGITGAGVIVSIYFVEYRVTVDVLYDDGAVVSNRVMSQLTFLPEEPKQAFNPTSYPTKQIYDAERGDGR